MQNMKSNPHRLLFYMKEFAFKINGAEYKCAVEEIEAGKTNVTVNGHSECDIIICLRCGLIL